MIWASRETRTGRQDPSYRKRDRKERATGGTIEKSPWEFGKNSGQASHFFPNLCILGEAEWYNAFTNSARGHDPKVEPIANRGIWRERWNNGLHSAPAGGFFPFFVMLVHPPSLFRGLAAGYPQRSKGAKRS